MRLVLLAACLTACTASPGRDLETDPGEEGARAPVATPERQGLSPELKFTPAYAAGLITVLSELERVYFRAFGEPLRVVAELKWNHDSAGVYDVDASYSGVAAFAAAMQAQDTAYAWSLETYGGHGFLVVKPAYDAYLDKIVGPFSQSDKEPCGIIAALNDVLDGSRAKTGCMLRDRPTFVAAQDAATAMKDGVSVFLAGAPSAQVVTLALLTKIAVPLSLTIYRIDSKMQYVWEVSW